MMMFLKILLWRWSGKPSKKETPEVLTKSRQEFAGARKFI
jgi:hypothetical protein